MAFKSVTIPNSLAKDIEKKCAAAHFNIFVHSKRVCAEGVQVVLDVAVRADTRVVDSMFSSFCKKNNF